MVSVNSAFHRYQDYITKKLPNLVYPNLPFNPLEELLVLFHKIIGYLYISWLKLELFLSCFLANVLPWPIVIIICVVISLYCFIKYTYRLTAIFGNVEKGKNIVWVYLIFMDVIVWLSYASILF